MWGREFVINTIEITCVFVLVYFHFFLLCKGENIVLGAGFKDFMCHTHTVLSVLYHVYDLFVLFVCLFV